MDHGAGEPRVNTLVPKQPTCGADFRAYTSLVLDVATRCEAASEFPSVESILWYEVQMMAERLARRYPDERHEGRRGVAT